MDWEKARRRGPVPSPPKIHAGTERNPTHLPPTAAQLDFLRKLAVRNGTRFVRPRTKAQAGARIQQLLQ
jgi:hypothetical protein